LDLYDSERIKSPIAKGKAASWDTVNKEIKEKLAAANTKQAKIRIVSSTIISPTTKKAIESFTTKYPTAKLVTYDAMSQYGIIKEKAMKFSNESSFK